MVSTVNRRVCAALLRRQQQGRTPNKTFVSLDLNRLKEFARKFDPREEKFLSIFRHSPTEGSWDDFTEEEEERSGNTYTLLEELYYLKEFARGGYRDEILRWIWTCEGSLKTDLRMFSLCPL